MKISEIMSRAVEIARPDDSLQSVARQMRDIDTGVIPVCDGLTLKGMVTDRDIVIRAVAEGLDLDTAVSEVMSGDVQTCVDTDNVADAAAKMGSHQIRRLIVLDGQGKLAGILSLGDIAQDYGAKAVGRTLEEISEDTPAAH